MAHFWSTSLPRSLDFRMKDFLEERCSWPNIVVIGETGLCSKASLHTPYYIKDKAFDFQTRLASRLGKPLIIHCRDNTKPALDCCRQYLHHSHKLHLHCFTGDTADAQTWMNHFPNLKIGVTGLVLSDPNVQML